MVSRVLKNKLRELLRAVKSTDEADNRAVIGHFLHLMMDPTSALWSPSTAEASAAANVSVSVMSQVREKLAGGCDIEITLRARFPSCLDGEASAGGAEGSGNGIGGFKLVEHLQLGALFVRVAQLAGLKFSEPFVRGIWRRHDRTSSTRRGQSYDDDGDGDGDDEHDGDEDKDDDGGDGGRHGSSGGGGDDDPQQSLSLVSPQRILDSLISIDTIVRAPEPHSLARLIIAILALVFLLSSFFVQHLRSHHICFVICCCVVFRFVSFRVVLLYCFVLVNGLTVCVCCRCHHNLCVSVCLCVCMYVCCLPGDAVASGVTRRGAQVGEVCRERLRDDQGAAAGGAGAGHGELHQRPGEEVGRCRSALWAGASAVAAVSHL